MQRESNLKTKIGAFHLFFFLEYTLKRASCFVLLTPMAKSEFFGVNLKMPQVENRGRRGGLMVSAFDPRASGLCSSLGRGHSIVLLGKTFHSHSSSLHPDVYLGTSELDAEV